MTQMTRVEMLDSRAADRSAGRRAPSADVGLVRVELDTIASELAQLWSSALDRGDFEEITRLVAASHAVHRAVISLTDDSVVPANRPATS